MATVDLIKKRLEEVVSKYRHRDFQTFLLPEIHITEIPGSTSLDLGHPRRLGYRSYRVKTFAETLWTEIHVSLSVKGQQITFRSAQYSLTNFLDSRPRNPNPIDGSTCGKIQAYDLQFRWWHGNNKTFNIMSLPDEIRQQILGDALPSVLWPNRKSFWSPSHEQYYVWKPVPTILLLNRRIHDEMKRYLLTYANFAFRSGFDLNKCLRRLDRIVKHGIPISGNIKRMQLAIGAGSLLHLAGGGPFRNVGHIESTTANRDPVFTSCDIFHELDLTHLELYIPKYDPCPRDYSNPLSCDNKYVCDKICLTLLYKAVAGQSGVSIVRCTFDLDTIALFEKACAGAAREYQAWKATRPGQNLTDFRAWKGESAADWRLEWLRES